MLILIRYPANDVYRPHPPHAFLPTTTTHPYTMLCVPAQPAHPSAIPGSRQGCFKCGNLGHIAENCQAPARLCYNCREAGHESTDCPHPRTTDGKQCYACGGVGHVKADCPTARAAAASAGPGQKCYHCARPGHIARMCPAGGAAAAAAAGGASRRMPSRGGFGGFGRPPARVPADGAPVKC